MEIRCRLEESCVVREQLEKHDNNIRLVQSINQYKGTEREIKDSSAMNLIILVMYIKFIYHIH